MESRPLEARFVPSPVFPRLKLKHSPMDIDKVGRVRSYVHTQLAFVPFYGTDLLDPGDSMPEVSGPQTPVLTARNPLATLQPGSNHPPASVCLEELRSSPTKTSPPLIKRASENQKNKRPANHDPEARERRLLRSKRSTQAAPDLDPSSEPMKLRNPPKGGRKSRRDKTKLPAGLSFLQGFAPRNVGPSRLTVSHPDTL